MKKNILLAQILSFIIPGSGQMYLGLWKRGLLWFGGTMTGGVALSFLFPALTPDNVFVRAVALGIAAASMWDTKLQAQKLNNL